MSTPLLVTKLYRPPPRPNGVPRPRLIARLDAGLHRKLTLIAAPAGFGKTTLVGTWVAGCGQPVAWLSLNEGDNDPAQFLTYLVMALRTIAPTLGESVLGALQAPPSPPIEALLTALLNEISILPEDVVLVLDDYHVIEARPVDSALTFLLDHLPSQIHVVIATREDPQLPLARLRARDQLTELRAADLRFTPAEAAAFLKQVMGLDLSAEDVIALDTRTEGWIAGLQLAALSLQGHQDASRFIRAFAGDHRYIADYLVGEVLQRQGDGVRRFLLQTAILDRLTGPLCDAVTGQQGGAVRLDALERGNFFVVPLDEQRQWYRYHHLFADVLRAHLRTEQPDQVPALHRRASAWYERHGPAGDAIHHALAAEDVARAADLIEPAIPDMRRSRQEATVLRWLTALPDDLIRRRPVLNAVYAAALFGSGVLEGVEDRLRDAERWLDATADRGARPDDPSAGMVVVDEEAFRCLPGFIALHRAGLALARGDVPETVRFARRVLEVAPEDDHLQRGGATAFLGLASWTSGDLEAAYRTYADGMAGVQRAGHLSYAVSSAIALADIRSAQGRLREAMSTYQRALQLAQEQSTSVLQGTADLHVGMSELHRERNELEAARQDLLRSKELGERTRFPQNWSRWCVAMARIRQVAGDLDGALDLLQEAERQYAGDFFPNVRPIAALVTRVWVAQGRVGEALGWAREQGLSAQDDLTYLREFEHITLVRVLLAQDKSAHADRSEALGLLERLLHAAEDGERAGSVIEILVVQALAHQAKGDISAALLSLHRALTLAEPEGYVRLFVDEGPPMAVLLDAVAKQRIALTYVRYLRTACGTAEDRTPVNQALIEPLSDRERDVLRLLGTDLTGPEIARGLSVSLSTMRTHTQSIFGKLGVTNRRAAVHRAQELDLL